MCCRLVKWRNRITQTHQRTLPCRAKEFVANQGDRLKTLT